jgi:hypothetical protein
MGAPRPGSAAPTDVKPKNPGTRNTWRSAMVKLSMRLRSAYGTAPTRLDRAPRFAWVVTVDGSPMKAKWKSPGLPGMRTGSIRVGERRGRSALSSVTSPARPDAIEGDRW